MLSLTQKPCPYCTIEVAHSIVSTSEEDDGATGMLEGFAGGAAAVVAAAGCDVPRRPPSINIKSSSLRKLLDAGGDVQSSSQLPERRYKRPEELSLEGVLRSNRCTIAVGLPLILKLAGAWGMLIMVPE